MTNIDKIVAAIGKTFPTFGNQSGQSSYWNPVAEALKDKPLMFAAGVYVEDVVRFVLKMNEKE